VTRLQVSLKTFADFSMGIVAEIRVVVERGSLAIVQIRLYFLLLLLCTESSVKLILLIESLLMDRRGSGHGGTACTVVAAGRGCGIELIQRVPQVIPR